MMKVKLVENMSVNSVGSPSLLWAPLGIPGHPWASLGSFLAKISHINVAFIKH